jgi:hypothetical protein
MHDDPILKEIRHIRRTIDEELAGDGQKFYEFLFQVQRRYTTRLVRRGPKPRLKLRERKS